MNWFEEQINARQKNDRNALNEAYSAAVDAVIGESFSFEEAEDELTTILRFYHMPPVKLSNEIKDDQERLSAVCRISGLMQRPVVLEKGWYKVAFGAYLCVIKETNELVAVLPDNFGSYTYYDKQAHKKITLNRKTESNLTDDAICFYKPLPSGKLTILDVMKFGFSSCSVSDLIMIVLMLGLSTLAGLLAPKLNYFLIGKVIEEGAASLLLSTMFFLISANLASVFFNSMKSMFTTRGSVKIDAAIQSATMMRVLSLPLSFFRKYSSGEIMSRMGYLQIVSSQIANMVFNTLLSGVFSLAYISQIMKYAPALVIPSICILLLQVLFTTYAALRQIRVTKKQMELGAKNNAKAIEMISGIQKIKISGSEKRMFARYTKSFAEESKIKFNPPFLSKYSNVITVAISYIGVLLIYFISIRTQIGLADYYAFQSAYGVVSATFTALASIVMKIAFLKPGLEMVKPMLEAIPETNEKAQEVTRLSGNIELNNLTFHYEENGPNIVDDLSMKINAGEYVAIVGKTGCGKTTLVRLLLGFEKPQKGSIYYDGRDLNLLEKRSLRQKIGTVMQDDRLFNGSIASNILICAPALPLQRAWDAAEIAGIAEDIRRMPMGMHTLISEGGGGISGGQRQRLAIARAIAPKPKILIFDEATSALDNVTQKKVSEALDSLKCTRIVIAHRLSTIQHCDRIILLDKGKILEEGTYEELIAKGGAFAELVNRQRL